MKKLLAVVLLLPTFAVAADWDKNDLFDPERMLTPHLQCGALMGLVAEGQRLIEQGMDLRKLPVNPQAPADVQDKLHELADALMSFQESQGKDMSKWKEAIKPCLAPKPGKEI